MKKNLSAFVCCAAFLGAVLLQLTSCSDSDSPRRSSTPLFLTQITSPQTGDVFEEGQAVLLEGESTDPAEGPLSGADLVWSSDVDGLIGVGASLTTSSLSVGLHQIVLTATNSSGEHSSADVFVQITESQSTLLRTGEINPYASRIERLPVKLDDELVVIARSNTLDQALMSVVEKPVSFYNVPSSAPTPPITTSTRDGLTPIAAAAGRLIGSAFHQAAVVTRSDAGEHQLEVLGLASPSSDPRNDCIAAYSFAPPSGPIDVLVADLDAFEEASGARVLFANRSTIYSDEAALAYAEPVGSETYARIDVLSFETAEFPQDIDTPALEPTSVTTAWTTLPMHPASRLVLRHGDKLLASAIGPHLLLAYVDPSKRIAIELFEHQHTRDDPDTGEPLTDVRALVPVMQATLSAPLSDAAVAAGGWDVVVGASEQLGVDAYGDVVMVVHHDSGQFVQQLWALENFSGSGSGPQSLGLEQGEFARVSSGGTPLGLSILSDSRLRLSLGRITLAPNQLCEAIGVFVLADTNRGAVVQSFKAFVEDSAIGDFDFGPVNPVPPWPSVGDIVSHPATAQTTETSLVAGGFVTYRNGLIDARNDPGFPATTAVNCPDARTDPFLGPMPSFYVADTETLELHAVTLPLSTPNGTGAVATTTMDASIDERPILLAADVSGDAAYYGALQCLPGAAPSDCRRVFLGDAELHYVIQDVESSTVLLQAPPKHVDYLPALGGVVNVSMRDDFHAQFTQIDVADGRFVQKLKTDWGVGARTDVALGPPKPKGGFSSILELSMDLEHRSVQENFQAKQTKVSLTQTTGAVDDDVVWGKQQTIDYWRFPAQGGDASADGADALPEDAYIELAIPDRPLTLVGAGTLNDSYQPTHTVGNVLSYPTFSGVVAGLGELFDYLGSFVPSDAQGTRLCEDLPDGTPGCIVEDVTGALQRVSAVLASDKHIAGEFQRISQPIDVAQVLQVGGITYSAELEFSNSVQSGGSVTNNNSIKADANVKIPLKIKIPVKGIPVPIPIPIGQLKQQLRADASFENSRVSENSAGSTMKVSLNMPSDVPVERSYQIRPSFGYTSWGGLRVAYEVSTAGPSSVFWEQNYGAPDPALNMPHRIVRTANGYELGTDFSRGRIKGFFVRDGRYVDPMDPGSSLGELLTDVPRAGDVLQLQVRVSNLSVATHVLNLKVRFTAQEFRNGQPVGAESFIDEATLDFLPHRGQFPDHPEGHIQSAFVLWDTTGFGPPPGDALVTYMIRVTLDPANQLPGETHELFDRYDDPLTGPTGQTIDPTLEKGQNNTGWSLMKLSPSLAPVAAPLSSGRPNSVRELEARSARTATVRLALLDGATGIGQEVLRGRLHEPISMSIELRSDRVLLEYGALRVFDGDPEDGGALILSRTIQGVDPRGDIEAFTWRPTTRGARVLHAVYSGAEGVEQPVLRVPAYID